MSADNLDDRGPFHDGELTMQLAAGGRLLATSNGRVIANQVVDRAANFVADQQLAVVATAGAHGQPWCSLLLAPRGSFLVESPTTLTIDRRASATDNDPLWDNLRRDARIGVLFIELDSRRRYRINGRIADPDANPLEVDVDETFPNCPKYIQRRHLVLGRPATSSTSSTSTALGSDDRASIEAADTLFVATLNPSGGLDASHRGGTPGFVDVTADRLVVPDYDGNHMFQTLGNLAVHPRAGLLFVNFTTGDTLQVNGTVAIDLDAPVAHTGGTGRAWTLTVETVRRARLMTTIGHELLDPSPHNP